MKPFITLNWKATVQTAGDTSLRKDFPMDAINLLPLLSENEKDSDRTFYCPSSNQRSDQQAWCEGKWKYLKDEKREYLFDLLGDETETKEVKETHPHFFQGLKEKGVQRNETMLKPVPL